ncbi:MAG: hypothetical protein HN337_04365 [Deltaproteobacteria bacterium]|jgi:hypothetical protein|nr:hypothetical protein [Deltaproteobacteria bacterium]
MKKRKAHLPFIDQLRHAIKSLKKMKPGEVHVLSINANYGHYQIVIGPEESSDHNRSIEINGEIHHLFVTPKNISAQPSKRQVEQNLKNTVIMRNLMIHLRDPKGDGKHLIIMSKNDNGLHPRECINLAGNDGERLMNELEHKSSYSLAAYRIIQKDILSALKKNKKPQEVTEH